MRVTWTIVSAAAALSAVACTAQQSEPAPDSAASPPSATSTAEGASGTTAAGAAGTMASDPDQATGGSGLPAGYTGHTDNPGAALTAAKYTPSGGQWEVTTGPAHIVYKASDTATGQYTASATFEQLEAPRHPEAYGIIIGGQNLDQPTQRYTYFIVRGAGEYAVKVRDGTSARDVIAFRAGERMPKADASGRATYRLAVQVTADSVRFLVNDSAVGSVAKSAVPSDGVAGLRINHNLHLRTGPVKITS